VFSPSPSLPRLSYLRTQRCPPNNPGGCSHQRFTILPPPLPLPYRPFYPSAGQAHHPSAFQIDGFTEGKKVERALKERERKREKERERESKGGSWVQTRANRLCVCVMRTRFTRACTSNLYNFVQSRGSRFWRYRRADSRSRCPRKKRAQRKAQCFRDGVLPFDQTPHDSCGATRSPAIAAFSHVHVRHARER